MGILKAAEVLAEVAFRAGHDVKRAEVHGMSQRGGSVVSEVRFGPEVLSPLIPAGETDFLLLLTPEDLDLWRGSLRPGGRVFSANDLPAGELPHKMGLNVALLGLLSRCLEAPENLWTEAIRGVLPEGPLQANLRCFDLGRRSYRNQ
jgi:indolepyruvate ferredoxin oxidoreductase beta subunit